MPELAIAARKTPRPRRFHLVAAASDMSRVLAFSTPAGWLLPWLDDDHCRELPIQLESMLEPFGATAEIVHEAPLTACHPVGSSGDVYQGCFVAVVDQPTEAGNGQVPYASVPVDQLLSTSPALPLQRDALVMSLARLKMPEALFDSGPQVAAAFGWARERIRERTSSRVVCVARRRCMRHQQVARLQTNIDTFYLKAGVERTDEAMLTRLLSNVCPRQFPETLEIDEQNHRWLYRELRGDLLVGSRLTLESACAATRALASIQKQVMQEPAVRSHLVRRTMNAVDLCTRVDGIVRTAWESVRWDATDSFEEQTRRTIERWVSSFDAVRDTCAQIDGWRLPLTLAFSDFSGRNTLLTRDGIGFFDVEESYWTYPFLSLWPFMNEVSAQLTPDTTSRAAIKDGFVAEWSDTVGSTDMRRALRCLEFLGRLFGVVMISRELELEEQAFGSALPHGYLTSRLTPFVERFLAAKSSA